MDHDAADAIDALEQLLVECLDLIDTDGLGAVEPFLGRHPSRAAELRRLLASLESAGQLASGGEDALVPARIGDFRLLRRLGAGGMGVVYLAEQESLRRTVALKVLRPGFATSAVTRARFEREAQALARLRHPGIVAVHATGVADGLHYFVMQYVSGRGLDEVLHAAAAGKPGPTVAQITAWGRDLARALACAHAAGVVHRDVKPSNVRINDAGEPVLIDFGLARDADGAALTLTGDFSGTPFYASPEQVGGRNTAIGPPTDIYSLGVTLYEAIAGAAPFHGATTEQIFRRILAEEPPALRTRNPHVSRDLETVIHKAIAKEPDERYQDAEAFAADLDAVVSLSPVRASPPSLAGRMRRWVRRNPALAALSLVALVLLAALPVLWLGQRANSRAARAAEAVQALREARAGLAAYRALQGAMAATLVEVSGLTHATLRRYLSDEEHETLNRHERRLDTTSEERDRLYHQILSELGRAERIDPLISGTREVRAELHLERWREADRVRRDTTDPQVSLRAAAEAEGLRRLIEGDDPEGSHARELHPRHAFHLVTDPPGAEVHLFRFEEQSRILEHGEPRLVPVPIGSDGRHLPIAPGTWTLRVVRGADGIEPGDLVVRLAGEPIEGTVFVRRGEGAIRRLDRLRSIDGVPVRDRLAAIEEGGEAREDGGERTFSFARGGEPFDVRAQRLADLGLELAEPACLAEEGGMAALVLHDGVPRELVLPQGLRVRRTAAPPILGGPALAGTTPLAREGLENRAFLAVVRKSGYELVRMWIDLRRHERSTFDLRLDPPGRAPDEFVRVVVGPNRYWMLDREVTCAEYLDFLNAPETQARLRAGEGPVLLPRCPQVPLWKPPCVRGADGSLTLGPGWLPDMPILGVSFQDAEEYCAWRTRRAQAERPGIRFRLPICNETEVAGSSAGYFVFGSRFRARWVSSNYARARHSVVEPVLSHPIDESPLGVFDLAGSAFELTSTWFWKENRQRVATGGSWAMAAPEWFQVGHWVGATEDTPWYTHGFRMVAEL